MKLITGLTDQPNQQSVIVLPDGTPVDFTLMYRPQQQGWFYNLSCDADAGPFELNGSRLVSSPNILRNYRNLVTFGLLILTLNNVEPIGQTTFIDGTTAVFLLTAAEVAQVEALIYPGL